MESGSKTSGSHGKGYRQQWTVYISKETTETLKEIFPKELPFAGQSGWKSLFLRKIIYEWMEMKGHIPKGTKME